MSAERQWPDEAATRSFDVARCPEHGLHGARSECFVCGGPVEQVHVVALPPCPTCKGERVVFRSPGGLSGDYYDCLTCNGSGVERMVPEAALRAWIEEQRVGVQDSRAGRADVLDRLSVFLDSLHAEPGTDRSEG